MLFSSLHVRSSENQTNPTEHPFTESKAEELRPGLLIGWFFRSDILHCTFNWIISDGVVIRVGRNGNVLISSDYDSVELTTPSQQGNLKEHRFQNGKSKEFKNNNSPIVKISQSRIPYAHLLK